MDLPHRKCSARRLIGVAVRRLVQILRIQALPEQILVLEETLPFAIFGAAETKFLPVRLMRRGLQKPVRPLFTSSDAPRRKVRKKRKKMLNCALEMIPRVLLPLERVPIAVCATHLPARLQRVRVPNVRLHLCLCLSRATFSRQLHSNPFSPPLRSDRRFLRVLQLRSIIAAIVLRVAAVHPFPHVLDCKKTTMSRWLPCRYDLQVGRS